jgi:predicted nucleotidyltransferase
MPGCPRRGSSVTPPYFSPDISDFLRLLHEHEVHYLVVGGEAVIHYGNARLTGDIDLFFDAGAQNVGKLFEALREFWQGMVPGIADARELADPDAIFQFGVPPNRIDLLNRIDGVSFEDCWENRTEAAVPSPGGEVPVRYIGLAELIRNKTAAARAKDLDDLRFLRRISG